MSAPELVPILIQCVIAISTRPLTTMARPTSSYRSYDVTCAHSRIPMFKSPIRKSQIGEDNRSVNDVAKANGSASDVLTDTQLQTQRHQEGKSDFQEIFRRWRACRYIQDQEATRNRAEEF